MKPACAALVDVLASVRDDQLADPTPCSEYPVRDLIDHLDEVARGFAAMAGTDAGAGADVGARVTVLGTAWDDPATWTGTSDAGDGLELPNELWGRIAFTEVVVHGWDLATATGQPFDLPAETLRACLDHVTEFVPKAPVPGLWGPVVTVSSDAPLMARVVAATGRTP